MIQGNINLNQILHKFLTDEQALSFWQEINPDSEVFSTTQFENGIKKWLESNMKIVITQAEAQKITEIVLNIENPHQNQSITARQVNLFFLNIPQKFPKQYLLSRINEIHKIYIQINQFILSSIDKVKNNMGQEDNFSELDNKIKQQGLFVKFSAKGFIEDQQQNINYMDVNCLYIFFDGKIIVFGNTGLNQTYELQGRIQIRFEKNIQFYLHNVKQDNVKYEGAIDGNLFSGYITENDMKKQFQITLELKRWVGFYTIGGESYKQDNQISIKKNIVVGFGYYEDSDTYYVWKGSIDENKYAIILETHLFTGFTSIYQGQFTTDHQNIQVLEGKWNDQMNRQGTFKIIEQVEVEE